MAYCFVAMTILVVVSWRIHIGMRHYSPSVGTFDAEGGATLIRMSNRRKKLLSIVEAVKEAETE